MKIEKSILGKIGSMNDLITALVDQFERGAEDMVTATYLQAMSNVANSIVKGCQTQIVYAKMKGKEPLVPFLDNGIGKKQICGKRKK